VSKLDELLKMEDRVARQKAMLEFARALKVDSFRARKEDGDLDEDVLTVLIYDADLQKSSVRTQNTGLLVGAVLVALMVIAAIYLLARLLAVNY